MRALAQNKLNQLYEIIFPQPLELTQEEKQEIIDDFNGSDSGKKINSHIRIINSAINILCK